MTSGIIPIGHKACSQESTHNYLRTDVFKYCPECGIDLVEWQCAMRELKDDPQLGESVSKMIVPYADYLSVMVNMTIIKDNVEWLVTDIDFERMLVTLMKRES